MEHKKRLAKHTLNGNAILRIIPYICQADLSIRQLASDIRLSKRAVVRILEAMGADIHQGDTVSFTAGDKLKIALEVMRKGVSINEVSRYLSWKDFEGLAGEILELYGYSTRRNLRLKHPRIEIDVLASKEGLCLVIDCKHWRRSLGFASITKIALQQTRRAKALMASHYARDTLKHALPVIMTLYTENTPIIFGVPIVPIDRFSGFINELDCYLPNLALVKRLFDSGK